jgi:hypothetical protein
VVDGCPVDPVDGLPFTERVRRIADLGFEAVAAALERLGYRGVVGLEAWASGDPLQALSDSAPPSPSRHPDRQAASAAAGSAAPTRRES